MVGLMDLYFVLIDYLPAKAADDEWSVDDRICAVIDAATPDEAGAKALERAAVHFQPPRANVARAFRLSLVSRLSADAEYDMPWMGISAGGYAVGLARDAAYTHSEALRQFVREELA